MRYDKSALLFGVNIVLFTSSRCSLTNKSIQLIRGFVKRFKC